MTFILKIDHNRCGVCDKCNDVIFGLKYREQGLHIKEEKVKDYKPRIDHLISICKNKAITFEEVK